MVAILGPTGAGKSEVAFEIAERLGAEILVCDSRQVYRHLDIATNKPPPDHLRRVPHHLIDVAHPRETFTVHDFLRLATGVVDSVARRGRTVVLEGGSTLWADALLDGYRLPGDQPVASRRAELVAAPLEELRARLRELDPSADVDLQNPRRVVRAIEILERLGPPLRRYRQRSAPDWCVARFGLAIALPELDRRLTARSQQQVARGLAEETRRALAAGVPKTAAVMTGIGYAQALAYLRGELDDRTLPEAMAVANRRYARRQLRWLRRDPRIRWVTATERPAARILSELRS